MERLEKKGTLPGTELFDLAMKNVNGYIIQKLPGNEKFAKRYAEWAIEINFWEKFMMSTKEKPK